MCVLGLVLSLLHWVFPTTLWSWYRWGNWGTERLLCLRSHGAQVAELWLEPTPSSVLFMTPCCLPPGPPCWWVLDLISGYRLHSNPGSHRSSLSCLHCLHLQGLRFLLSRQLSYSQSPKCLAVCLTPRLGFCFCCCQDHGTVPGGTGNACGFYKPMDFWREMSVDLLASLNVEMVFWKLLRIYLHGNLPTKECTVIQRNLLPILFRCKVTLNQVWVNIDDFFWNVTDSWHGN